MTHWAAQENEKPSATAPSQKPTTLKRKVGYEREDEGKRVNMEIDN